MNDFILITRNGTIAGIVTTTDESKAIAMAHRLGYKRVCRAVNFNL